MLLSKINLQINTPTGPTKPGRGFYQLEDEALFVQIGHHSSIYRFFSYLESDKIRLDLDRSGNLLFIEVDCPRRLWKIDDSLTLPDRIEPAEIKWFDFRQQISNPTLITNHNRTVLKLEFLTTNNPKYFYLAKDVIIECDQNLNFGSIWILNIVDDLAGREIRNFRITNRNQKPYFI